MTEYINKAELLNELKKEFKNYESYGDYGTHPAEMKAQRVIANLPTIDIVHCKDCKYCKIEDWDRDNFRVCTRDQHIRSGSWFCADGERRTENE